VSSRFAYVLNPDGYVQYVEVGEYPESFEGCESKITESAEAVSLRTLAILPTGVASVGRMLNLHSI
jgi:hypothetical protein